MSQTAASPTSEAAIRVAEQQLFANPALRAYAVLDGAAIPDLLPKLADSGCDHVCLYRGELEPDLAECAPYLVHFPTSNAFLRWILTEGWTNHWGIFAVTPADLQALRRHFRTYLLVLSPEGKRLYFRFYDPRVLRVYLPTCTAAEARTIFGPVGRFLCPSDDGRSLLSFTEQKYAPPEAIALGTTS